MRYLTPILLAFVVLSSGCDPDGYSCNFEGCYEDDNNPQFQILEDCNSLCDEAQQLGSCGTPILHEGYIYSTVLIGDQCWFSENCRYLPVVSPSSAGSETSPYYYVYDYEGTDVEEAKATANYETYGVLYNWPAVMTDEICPSDWHVPSDEEWQTMEMSLGMSEAEASSTGYRGTDEGYQMKSTSGWDNNGNGSNASGFNGLPGGERYSSDFGGSGGYGFWWSFSVSNPNVNPNVNAYPPRREMSHYYNNIYRNISSRYKGFSARCVRD
jgi:uncharacterized protein (TIGR02145 family)